jgi:hypothetical protein
MAGETDITSAVMWLGTTAGAHFTIFPFAPLAIGNTGSSLSAEEGHYSGQATVVRNGATQ